MPNTLCPICSSDLQENPVILLNTDASRYKCPRCGQFTFSDFTKADQNFEPSKQLISAWIRRQNKLGNAFPLVGDTHINPKWFESLRQMGFPETVNKKLDELLKAYAEIIKDEYGKIVKISLYPHLVAEIAAKNTEEVQGLNQLLQELEYIWSEPSHPNLHIRITAKGWLHIDELSRLDYPSDTAFIAMWYDGCMENYLNSVIQAVTYCGYRPLVIKDINFNNFVMDEVISLIRQSRFLIADLTCKPEIDEMTDSHVKQGVRGGVYWESGMAYGMGKVVIQTCESSDESKRRIHFDLDQYQTIFWKQEELTMDIRDLSGPIQNPNFTEKLAQRIITTVGRGSYDLPP